jgi:hypothetical protein
MLAGEDPAVGPMHAGEALPSGPWVFTGGVGVRGLSGDRSGGDGPFAGRPRVRPRPPLRRQGFYLGLALEPA